MSATGEVHDAAAPSRVQLRASPTAEARTVSVALVDATSPEGPSTTGARGATVSTVQPWCRTIWLGRPASAVTVKVCAPLARPETVGELLAPQPATGAESSVQATVVAPVVV